MHRDYEGAASDTNRQSLVDEENTLLLAAKEAADRGRLPEFVQNLRTGLRRTAVADIGLRLVDKGFVEAEIKARFAKADVFLRILRLTTAGFDKVKSLQRLFGARNTPVERKTTP